MIGPTIPSTSSPCAAWKAVTARLVWWPKMPSAEIPSARCMAATSGPRLPSLSMPAEASVTSVPCARAASWAGASTVAVISAAETSARFLRYAGVRRSAAYSRRRWERASERSHSSMLARSRRPGGCERMAHPS